jgi:hypothetical protein
MFSFSLYIKEDLLSIQMHFHLPYDRIDGFLHKGPNAYLLIPKLLQVQICACAKK